MRRIPIQIEEETYQALKARAFREGRSIADIVRESIALANRNARPRSIEDFTFVGSGSNPADRKERTSENHDRALAEAYDRRQKKRR